MSAAATPSPRSQRTCAVATRCGMYVVDWVSTHLDDDAAALFIAQLERARELRAEGRLSDAHTMTSWALQESRAQMHRRNR